MLLIGNGVVVTRDKNNTYLENGAVCIKDRFVYDIGPFEELQRKYKEADYIDAHGGVIMPGLINTHNHIYSAFARGMMIPNNSPATFLEILEGTWWKLDRQLSLEQIRFSAKATYVDCIKNGVTTVFDHHASYGAIEGSLSTIAKAAEQTGVRTCLSYEISDRDGKEKMKQAVKENMDFLECAKKDTTNMVKAMIGIHASFTVSEETLDYCMAQNRAQGGYHIHVAEAKSDALHCQETYHMSIVERLEKRGLLGPKTIAAHCVHINEEDLERLKETNTIVVHNPESNMGNAVGCPDVLSMVRKGIVVGLGTDGYTNDMLESMKVANLLQKHNSKNPSAAWTEIPTMLFERNREIAKRFFEAPLGVLQKGACGDLIVLDYHPTTPMNQANINSHILFGMNGTHTVTTIINGEVVMKDRRLTQIDEIALGQHCREQANRLWKSVCK